jgi:3-oxoacyl-[acyl-carrier protein] reductase
LYVCDVNFSHLILKDKVAIIYGAGGSLGSEVAKEFSKAGAKLFLTGRNLDPLQKIMNEIIHSGGSAQAHVVDALDENAIRSHVDLVVNTAGSVDISFNLTGSDVVQNIPLVDMDVKDFIQPITIFMQTRFMTAVAAAKVMIKQKSGVILSLTATPGGIGYPYTGGFAPTCCAIESLCTNLGGELGVHGVRVVNIRSAGSPDSKLFREAIENQPEIMKQVLQKMKDDTMTKRLPPMADITNVAVFLASSMANSITGVTIDVTSGSTAGLNYRATPSQA